jgi:hypothetical protein
MLRALSAAGGYEEEGRGIGAVGNKCASACYVM